MGNTTCCSDQHRHDSELDLSISKQQTLPKAVVAVAKDSAISLSKNIDFRDTKPETAHLQSLEKHAQHLEIVEMESDQSDGVQEGRAQMSRRRGRQQSDHEEDGVCRQLVGQEQRKPAFTASSGSSAGPAELHRGGRGRQQTRREQPV